MMTCLRTSGTKWQTLRLRKRSLASSIATWIRLSATWCSYLSLVPCTINTLSLIWSWKSKFTDNFLEASNVLSTEQPQTIATLTVKFLFFLFFQKTCERVFLFEIFSLFTKQAVLQSCGCRWKPFSFLFCWASWFGIGKKLFNWTETRIRLKGYFILTALSAILYQLELILGCFSLLVSRRPCWIFYFLLIIYLVGKIFWNFNSKQSQLPHMSKMRRLFYEVNNLTSYLLNLYFIF